MLWIGVGKSRMQLELQLRMRDRSEADVMQTKHQDSFAIKVWEGGFFLKANAQTTCRAFNM